MLRSVLLSPPLLLLACTNLTPYKRGNRASESKARANWPISRPQVQSIYSVHLFQCRDTFYPPYYPLVPIGHTQLLIRGGGKRAHQTIRLIISFDVPLLMYTRVMLAWVHNKKSSLKPVRNSSNVGFYVTKRACLRYKIVPRARNYDLNRTRTTLTAKHKT